MFDLVISIVNHNNRRLLQPFLSSILKHTTGITFTIYVVDNASSDGSAEMIKQMFPQVHLIQNTEPKGFAANHNQVLQRVEGRYLVLLNDDMLLEDNALKRLVDFMDARPEVGATGCKLLKPDGSLQRSAWVGFPSPRALFTDLFYLSAWLSKLEWVKQAEVIHLDSQQPLEVDHVLGACLMVRAEMLDQVGLIDESFFMYLEETDWCYRIRQAGWKIYWVPEAEIIHYGQQSVSGDLRRFIPMRYRNYCKFCRKHGSNKFEVLVLKLIIFFGSLLRAGLWGLRGLRGYENGYAMMRGYVQVLCNVSSF